MLLPQRTTVKVSQKQVSPEMKLLLKTTFLLKRRMHFKIQKTLYVYHTNIWPSDYMYENWQGFISNIKHRGNFRIFNLTRKYVGKKNTAKDSTETFVY